MKLISPNGVRISVSDLKGELLLAQGYKQIVVEPVTPAPAAVRPAPRKRAPRKTD